MSVQESRLAQVYAQALFDISGDKAETILKEFEDFVQGSLSHKELSFVLRSSVFSPGDQKAVVEKILDSNGVSKELRVFLLFVCEKGRISLFADICTELLKLIENKNSIIRGTVKSAYEMPEGELTELKSALEKSFSAELGKSVNLKINTVVDPELIAGYVIEANGKTFDSSVKGKFSKIRKMAEL
jgi:F-type H+-transporting ATPase subunit delta